MGASSRTRSGARSSRRRGCCSRRRRRTCRRSRRRARGSRSSGRPGSTRSRSSRCSSGFPTYGSTQTIFGQLQWESIYLEQNEYKEWPPVTTLEVTIPSAITTQLALPWGGFPHPVWFKDHPQIANVRAFGGLLDRSIMEGIVAGQRDYQEKIKPLPPDEQRAVLAGIADSMQPGLPAAREPAPAAHGRRRRRARQPRDGPRVRARPGRLPPDRPDPGVRRPPPRPPAAAQGRLRLAGRGLRPPRAARRRSRPTGFVRVEVG